ncbi:MAG: polymer-forming cytoskeletal protein [Eubacterium sp.]|nr:polymer-forming cytoskeletal protein [Eubacterium sp.]
MAKYKNAKQDFAQAVSQLTQDSGEKTIVDELKEKVEEEVGELLMEEKVQTEERKSDTSEVVKNLEDVTELTIGNDSDINAGNILTNTPADEDEYNSDSNLDSNSDIESDKDLDKESDKVSGDSSKNKSKNDSNNKSVNNSNGIDKIFNERIERSINMSGKGLGELEKEIHTNDEILGIGEDTTYITKGTTISGNIDSDSDVEVLGRVDGNIRCTGKLIVGGRVVGDIDAGDFYAESANISGEIRSQGTVKIGVGSVTIGNISAETAVIAGAVKGDIDIKDSVVIDSTAIVVGNIKSKSVQVNSGAIVDGFCKQVYSDTDLDKYFNSGIEDLN